MKETLEKRVVRAGQFACKVLGILLLVLVLLGTVLVASSVSGFPEARYPLLPLWLLLNFFTDGPGLFILLCFCLTAWLVSIRIFIEIAREKGYFCKEGSGWLWFAGIFATPIIPGIIVASLPERKVDEVPSNSVELPNF